MMKFIRHSGSTTQYNTMQSNDFTDFRSAKFQEICTQDVVLRRGESFRKEIFKIFPQGVVFSQKHFYHATQLCYSAVSGVVILSVCRSHACFVTNPKNLPTIFYTIWKGNHSSFLTPKITAKFQRGHPDGGDGGAKERWGRLKRRFSTNIWLYLTNGSK